MAECLQRMGDDLDLGRYESAVGWRQPDPYKKEREKAGEELANDEHLTLPILHEPNGDDAKIPEPLFANLWRTGEVALLYGEPGVGKSIFAVHLAEAIAGNDWNAGDSPALQKPARSKGEKLKRVTYIDLQRTESQFHQRFPNTALERLHFDWNMNDTEDNDNIRVARIHSSIGEAIDAGAEVIILDDITLGGINLGRLQGPLRTLRTLKMFAAKHGTSFLVIAGARPHKCPRAASLSDVAFRHIAEQADSVFCLARSTWSGSPPAGGGVDVALDGRGGGSFRYIRHLRSNSSPIIHDASNVISLLIGTDAEIGSQSFPPYEGGLVISSPPGLRRGADASSAGWCGRGGSLLLISDSESAPIRFHGIENVPASEDSSSCIVHPESCIAPQVRFIGTAPESAHIRDYAREIRQCTEEADRIRTRALNRLGSQGRLIDAPDIE